LTPDERESPAKRKQADHCHDLCPGTEDRADRVFAEVVGILAQARWQTARSVDTCMVTANWLIGWRIVEAEQGGETMLGYGERLIDGLSVRLTTRLGRAFSMPNLRNSEGLHLGFSARAIERTGTLTSGSASLVIPGLLLLGDCRSVNRLPASQKCTTAVRPNRHAVLFPP
jgi:hypothetical protein